MPIIGAWPGPAAYLFMFSAPAPNSRFITQPERHKMSLGKEDFTTKNAKRTKSLFLSFGICITSAFWAAGSVCAAPQALAAPPVPSVPLVPSASPSAAESDAASSEALRLLDDLSLSSQTLPARLESLARANPKSPGVREALGRAWERAGDDDRAIAAYQSALALDEHRPEAWLRLGILLKRNQRDPQGAVAALERALALGAPRARALNELGVALAYSGAMEKALRAWEEAIATDPGWGAPYANALKAALSLGDEKRARSLFESGASKAAERPEASLYIQWSEYLRTRPKKFDEALQAIGRGAAAFPDSAEMTYYQGEVLRSADRAAEARAAYTRAASLDPEGAAGRIAIWARRAMFIMDFPGDEKEFQACARQYFEALEKGGRDQAKRLEKSLKRLDALVAKHPDFWNAWLLRGGALRRLGRPEEARASLDRTLAIHPAEPNALQELGLLLREQGRAAEGRKALERALQIAPRDPMILMNLALIEGDLGMFDEAEARLARAESLLGGPGAREAQAVQPVRERIQSLRAAATPAQSAKN